MSRPKTKSGDLAAASENRPQRLFFALWPDASLRQPLDSRSEPLVQATSGRPVPAENSHITLAFLGNVDANQQACVERMAGAISSPSFEFTLDRFGYWSRSKVTWLAPSEVPEPLVLLADALSTGSRKCGLTLDARPYRPHLTLMRKATGVPDKVSIEPLLWSADRFVLVRSVSVPQGVRYEVLREWPLDS